MTFAMVMVILFVENVFVIQDGTYVVVIYIVLFSYVFHYLLRFGRRCECGSGNSSSTVENCPYVY